MDIRHSGLQFDLDSFGYEQNRVAVPSEHRHEISGCNKKWEILNQLSKHLFSERLLYHVVNLNDGMDRRRLGCNIRLANQFSLTLL